MTARNYEGCMQNLLLSSMDDRTAEYVHPSFVQLLKEISPGEAKLLSTLTGSDDAEHASIPLVDLRIVSADELVAIKWTLIVEGYNEVL